MDDYKIILEEKQTVMARADESGTCGNNATWTYSEKTQTLTISGSGRMYNYDWECSPFFNRSDINKVVIESGISSIGNFAFQNCNNVSFISIPNSVTRIGIYAFYNCSGLTSITIPNSVTNIELYAFYGCSGLASITIPNGVTSIGIGAFMWCSSLSSITIPNSVTKIGFEAFAHCTCLLSVTSNIEEPYYCKSNTFPDETYRKGTLYVPQGTKDLYTRACGWWNFLNIEQKSSKAAGLE